MMHEDSPDHDLLDQAINRELAALGAERPPSLPDTENAWRRISPTVQRMVRGYRPPSRVFGRPRWQMHTLRTLAACLLLGAITMFSLQTRMNSPQRLAQQSDGQGSVRDTARGGVRRDEHPEAVFPLPGESLRQAAGLLAQVTSEQVLETNRARSIARAGRQLLDDTRAVLDQSSHYDPATRALLTDLEYALVQVVQGGVTDPAEHELLVSTLTRRAIISRLRDAAVRGPRASS